MGRMLGPTVRASETRTPRQLTGRSTVGGSAIDRSAVGEVAVADQVLAEFAGGLAGEPLLEVDRTRDLVAGELRAAVCEQSGGEGVVGDHGRVGFDDGLDLLAVLVVREPEHRDVVDGRVGEQDVLDLLGVDVDAARVDRERLAVGEVDVAVVVEVADVAERATCSAACLRGLGLVAVIAEVIGAEW